MSDKLPKKTIYRGRIVDLTVEQVKLPNGSTLDMEIVHHPGGAAVVALNAFNQVCLLKQYRYVLHDWIWEIPAGKIDNKEEPSITAARELEEEGGVTARSWHSLGYSVSSPGVFSEIVHLYLAQDICSTMTNFEEHEVFEIHWIDFKQALQWAVSGEISDAKSVIALLRARDYLRAL